MTGGTFDAVVVGAGINGIVAAARLARAGWSVALVDEHERIGGFVDSGERTAPGWVHDTWSSWHPLFVTGPAYAEFGPDLHRLGLAYADSTDSLTATVCDDGTVTIAHRDVDATVAGFAEPADRAAYRAALDRFGAHAGHIGGLLGAELRSRDGLRPLWGLARAAGLSGVHAYARDTAMSGRAWTRGTFTGHEVDRLWSPWLLHAGLAPDSAGGGLMMPIFAATLHAAGLPVVVGGAAHFVTAWEALLDELGVEVLPGHRVERVLVDRGRAVGVAGAGWSVAARRAVLASVSPSALYGELLPAREVPAPIRDQASRYRPGRAAAQIHVALSGPVPWRDGRLASVPLVHICDGAASVAIACAETEAGLLPRRPTVVVGQQHVLDPSRVPDGAAALWLQLQEVPFAPVGDAAGELDVAHGWSPALAKGFTERVLRRVEAHAPGLGELVVGIDAITPPDITAHNRNAVAGDPYCGSAELDQNLLWRPLLGTPGHGTPVAGLWHIGAATHPGPGLSGASGHLVAGRLTRPGPVRSVATQLATQLRERRRPT